MLQEPKRSTADILGDALASVSALVRNEIDLARAELRESLNRALSSIVMLVAAAVLALTALNVGAAALVMALMAAGLSGGLAALILFAVLIVIAAVLAAIGISTLKNTSIAPERTARNVRRDAAAVKEAYND